MRGGRRGAKGSGQTMAEDMAGATGQGARGLTRGPLVPRARDLRRRRPLASRRGLTGQSQFCRCGLWRPEEILGLCTWGRQLGRLTAPHAFSEHLTAQGPVLTPVVRQWMNPAGGGSWALFCLEPNPTVFDRLQHTIAPARQSRDQYQYGL